VRCVNIDWLEVYCIEDVGRGTVDYFRSCGYYVVERDYGTRHFKSVFTLYDNHGDPFLEVRRDVRTHDGKAHSVYPLGACNLRLVNRYCYFDDAAAIMMNFIVTHNYEFRRIYRLDLCLDFVRFDSGDIPRKVVRRIVNHTYAKVYQAGRTVRGDDRWDGCDDNYLMWGKKGSMVQTRFYNKSKEMREVHAGAGKGKPWITQAWCRCGLIDDPVSMTKTMPNGSLAEQEVWRLEFAISSSARQWYIIDGDKKEFVEHTLETYSSRENLVQAVENLIRHYFQFRIFRKGIRKYDCPEKVLFHFENDAEVYHLSNDIGLARERFTNDEMFVRRLESVVPHVTDVNEKAKLMSVINWFRSGMLTQYRDVVPPTVLLRFKAGMDSEQRKEITEEEIREIISGTW